MTQIQHMMMVPIVHADYGYINMNKKPQETTDTSAHTRLRANVDPKLVPRRRRRLNLEAAPAHLSRACRQ